MFGRPIHAVAAILCATLALAAGCARKTNARVPVPPAPSSSATPSAKIGSTETGIASWYGRPYDGRHAASGEIYDMQQLTAAHRTLPFGTWLEVTNLQNQKSVDVRINDRGPFVDGRIIDLSLAAARAIDMAGPGLARVRLKVIAAPESLSSEIAPQEKPAASPPPPPAPVRATVAEIPPAPTVDSYAVQAGSFSDRGDAESFQATIRSRFEETRVLRVQSVWRVLVGRRLTLIDANKLAAKVLEVAGQGVVVPDR